MWEEAGQSFGCACRVGVATLTGGQHPREVDTTRERKPVGRRAWEGGGSPQGGRGQGPGHFSKLRPQLRRCNEGTMTLQNHSVGLS